MTKKNAAIVLAAGKGSRMGEGRGKAFCSIREKPLLAWTLSVFESFPLIQEIILVVPPNREQEFKEKILIPYNISKAFIVSGGDSRQESVQNGFAAIEEPCHLVVVHDGARPFLDPDTLEKALNAAEKDGASIVAVPVKETIKSGDDQGMVRETFDRSRLWSTQTPQTYKYPIIKEALESARKDNFYGTDDSSLVERIGKPIRIIIGSYENIKVTTPEDLVIAEAISGGRMGKE